jgi:hypothetical protein
MRRRASVRTLILVGAAVVVACDVACGPRADSEVRVIPDPAAARAGTLLDGADTAIAHGNPQIAQRAMLAAYAESTTNVEVAYRIARLADRLDDADVAARAYRRYLSLVPSGPDADSVRDRLAALDAVPAAGKVTSVGEVDLKPKTHAKKTHAARRHRRLAQR